MPVLIEDLAPGQVYTVRNQGTQLTPRSLAVRVHWVGPDRVHYQLARDLNSEFTPEIKETPIERFLEIVNQPPTAKPGGMTP